MELMDVAVPMEKKKKKNRAQIFSLCGTIPIIKVRY